MIIQEFFLLKENEKFKKAFDILQPLSTKYPENSKLFFLLGSTLYQQENFGKAKDYLQKAISLNPNHMLSSLGLVHTLANLNEWHTAFNELRRFLLSNSKNKKEHLFLLNLLKEKINVFPTSQKAIIKKLSKEFKDSKQ